MENIEEFLSKREGALLEHLKESHDSGYGRQRLENTNEIKGMAHYLAKRCKPDCSSAKSKTAMGLYVVAIMIEAPNYRNDRILEFNSTLCEGLSLFAKSYTKQYVRNHAFELLGIKDNVKVLTKRKFVKLASAELLHQVGLEQNMSGKTISGLIEEDVNQKSIMVLSKLHPYISDGLKERFEDCLSKKETPTMYLASKELYNR